MCTSALFERLSIIFASVFVLLAFINPAVQATTQEANTGASGAVLDDLVAGMAPGTWIKMPQNSTFDNLSLGYSLLYWADGGVWDSINDRVIWVGGPGSCCADPPIYKMITYTESNGAWQVSTTPFSGSGHAYDGNALDPSTGTLYFGKHYDDYVKVWDGSSWSELPELPWTGGVTPALAWFPELDDGNGGLVYAKENGKVAWYDGSSWHKINDGQSWPDYNNFAEYNPVKKVVWLGEGTDHYALDAQLNMRKLQTPPIDLDDGAALKSVDPVSGLYIVLDIIHNVWWQFNIDTDTWTQLAGMSGAPSAGESMFHVPLTEHGVIMYFIQNDGVYLYKHAAATQPTPSGDNPIDLLQQGH
jgi:hypothetical protein